MTSDGQELPFARDLREAIAVYAKRTFRVNTTLAISQAWGIDKTTAKNLLKGHASDATITRVLRAAGWDMAMTVIGSVIGHSIEDHLQERRRKNAETSLRLRTMARDLGSGPAVRGDLDRGLAERVDVRRRVQRG